MCVCIYHCIIINLIDLVLGPIMYAYDRPIILKHIIII